MQKLVEYADELVTGVGPRAGASEGEQQAAELIAANLEDLGLDTWIQDFSSAKGVGWMRALYYVIGVIAAEILFIAPGLKILSFILALIAFVLLALDLLGMNPIYNLVNQGQSQNVIARYSPEGADPRHKIVIMAHYDSGRSMLQCAPAVAPFYVLLRTAIRACVAVLLVVALLSLLPLPEIFLLFLSIVALIIGIVLLVAAIVEVINLFLPYNQGANCNASGVAVAMGVAETLTGSRGGSGLDTGRRSGRSSRARKRSSASSQEHYEEGDSYDEDSESQSDSGRHGATPRARAASSSGGPMAVVGGVVGAVGSAVQGLFGKSTPDARGGRQRDAYGEKDYHSGENGEYIGGIRPQQIRSGEVKTRGLPAPVSSSTSSQGLGQAERAFEGDNQAQDNSYDVDAGTADLGKDVSGAAREAAGSASDSLSLSRGKVERNGALHKGKPMSSRAGIPTDNPAIRKRPPLSEQEQREKELQAEIEARAVEESDRTAEGVPKWFVEAKKAAQKDSETKAGAEGQPKVARSRYADVPVEYKPKQEARPAVAQKSAPAIARSAEQQTNVPSEPKNVATNERKPVEEPRGASRPDAEEPRRTSEQAEDPRRMSEPTEDSRRMNRPDVEEPRRASQPERQQAQVSERTRRGAEDIAQRAPCVEQQEVERQQEEVPAEMESSAHEVPPTTLNADFSGIDRLTSDPLPKRTPRTSLPESATQLEREASLPSPEIPENNRLRNLPKLSLGDSGAIQTQQATFDQHTMFGDDNRTSDAKVSSTGSFAPLGATGIMKPVGEELLEYHEGNEEDIYIEDADESVRGEHGRSSRSGEPAPEVMEIPRSRTKSFFGNLGDKLSGNRKNEKLDSSPSAWLGVDEDFDARKEGSQIGGWDNFASEDDDDWKGGAYGGDSYEEDAEALAKFSSVLVDKEVWIVALGSHENKNAGIKNLLAEYNRDLKSAIFINIDGVGAGDLHYTMAEGTFRPQGTDHRLQKLIKSAANSLGLNFSPTGFNGYNTDAAAAASAGARTISIMGLDGTLPAGWRWNDDRLDILEEDNLEAVVDVVIEVMKSV